MNVLAIGAHPGDVELGAAGTLARHVARGDGVTLLVLTHGKPGDDDTRRADEQARAAEVLGATLLWGDFTAGSLPSGDAAAAAIEDAIRRAEASLVYTHAPDDALADHRAASTASLGAAHCVSTVLYYETPSTLHFQPALFVDVEDALETKLAVLRTRLLPVTGDGPLDLDAIVAQARFRGSQSRVRHAEAFETARFVWDMVPETAHDDAVLDALEGGPAAVVNEVLSIERAVRELDAVTARATRTMADGA